MCKKGSYVALALAVGLGMAAPARGGGWYTDVTDLFPTASGVYDESAYEANSVDAEAPGNAKTLAQFKSDLLAAYNGNYGDVIGFDHGRGPNPWGSQSLYRSEWSPGYGYAKNWIWQPGDSDYKCPTKLWYGKDYLANSAWDAGDGNGQYIEMSLATASYDFLEVRLQSNGGYDWRTATSGPGYLWKANDANYDKNMNGLLDPGELAADTSCPGTLNQGSGWGGNGLTSKLDFTVKAGTHIKELAITSLAKTSHIEATTVTMTASFSGGGSDVREYTVTADQDLFLYFAAPSGEDITALEWTADGTHLTLDDLAFILDHGGSPSWHPGDANKDGVVDLQDFGQLKDNFGVTAGATWDLGDFNADGAIDLQDFGILKDHFGHTNGDSPLQPVPEPGSAALLLVGLAAVLRRR